jgi:hypothetical protein
LGADASDEEEMSRLRRALERTIPVVSDRTLLSLKVQGGDQDLEVQFSKDAHRAGRTSNPQLHRALAHPTNCKLGSRFVTTSIDTRSFLASIRVEGGIVSSAVCASIFESYFSQNGTNHWTFQGLRRGKGKFCANDCYNGGTMHISCFH